MDSNDIKQHWESIAKKHAQDLKSTTKTPTIKKLEINAIAKIIENIQSRNDSPLSALEIGCGNGHNCLSLSKMFPKLNITGVDYSCEMISNAGKLKNTEKWDKVNFFVGDILDLENNTNLKDRYDIVFTDRCLINLNTIELQLKALKNLSKKVKTGGHLINIENSLETYNNQNFCRELLGLKKRIPDEYNLFIEEDVFLKVAKDKLNLRLIEINDFGSLHDIILYVLLPKICDGNIEYSHPIMDAVTELLLNLSPKFKNSFGNFGQNRLYLFKKLDQKI